MRRLYVLMTVLLIVSMSIAFGQGRPLIQRGDYNDNVIALHQKMWTIGCFMLRSESPWGPKSEEALMILQGALGWERTGIVENEEELNTLLALDEEKYHFEPDEIVTIKMLNKIDENLLTDCELSAGTTSNGQDGFEFTTATEGNAFSSVNWQLLSSENEYIETFDAAVLGLREGDYVFEHETGDYNLRFKANSSKKDEFATKRVHLEKNVIYHYMYNVVSIESNKVITKNVAFGKKIEH